jgi:3-deoxy-manno-octulosonate cytidylyltransferase (CMP-KDO synthetase)
MGHSIAIVIPARFHSKRFPGKPLAKIKGVSVIHRVWKIAMSIKSDPDIQNMDIEIIIATDNDSILNHCKEFGANVVMTSKSCRNGTERVANVAGSNYEVIKKFNDDDIFINFQGDAVLTPPWILLDLIKTMINKSEIIIGTPAVKLDKEHYEKLVNSKKSGIVGGTTVTFSKSGNALYFTKGIIPFLRDISEDIPVYRHIGMYGYRKKILLKLSKQTPTKLEITEGLEQLRALENDIPINVIVTNYKGRTHWSVDNPEDISIIEKIIDKEGELTKI